MPLMRIVVAVKLLIQSFPKERLAFIHLLAMRLLDES